MKISRKLKNKLKTSILAILLVLTVGIVGLATVKLTSEKEYSKSLEYEKVVSGYEEENSTQENSVEEAIVSDTIALASSFSNNLTFSSENIDNCQVATGNAFEVVLKKDGTVWTWGNNTYGQLGNGKIENINLQEPTQVVGLNGEGYLENIKQITAGAYTVSALTQDGKVVSWGRNAYGQFGNNSTSDSGVPVYMKKQVEITDEEGNVTTELQDLDNIIQISAGSSHLLAVDVNGNVWATGYNNYGQLGINVGNTSSSNANFKRIYAVKVQKAINIVEEDGTVTSGLADLDNVKKVSGGTDFSVALLNDGTVMAWGLGTSGQIGNNGASTVYIPNPVYDLTDVVDIDAGGLQTIALKSDGTVWAWGINRYGNLGINTSSTTTTNAAYKKIVPVQVLKDATTPLTDVVEISSLYETSYARLEDGTVFGWGLNTSGQIGDNTVANKTVATTVKKAGGEEIKGIKSLSDGQYANTNLMIDEYGYLYGNGVSSSYQMMSNRTAITYVAIKLDETVLKLSNNQDYIEIGESVNVNANYYNGFNVADYTKTIGTIEYRSSNEDIATVDNTGKVTAKSVGQVTIIAEDTVKASVAQSIINVVSKGAISIPRVASGTTFTAMLKEDGTVWTTGATGSGELGNGASISTNKPCQVKIDTNTYLTDIKKIEVGTQHVIALREDGTVWTWGLNSSGQLGDGTTTLSKYAIQVLNQAGDGFLENIVDIAAGNDNCAVVNKDGEVFAWGDSTNQGLGINSTTAQKKPVKVHGGDNAIQVQCGANNVLMLKVDGTVWGAGQNNVGQIADGTTTTTRAELITVTNSEKTAQLTGIMQIASGENHTVAIKEDGTGYIWGYNNYGQQGNNSTTNNTAPINLPGLSNIGVMENISDIATGSAATYIKTKNGDVYAVGLNTTGQLSIDTATTVKVFTVAKDENANDLTRVVSLTNSVGTTFGFAFEDGSVGVTGLGTSGQHGNLTWLSSNKMTRIENASITAGNLYELEVNETKKIELEVIQSFNLNIDNPKEIKTQSLSYESENTDIANVSIDGVITGVADGTTSIKIKDEENGLETYAQVIVGKRDLSDISKIVSGVAHTVMLKQDGTVWTWGENTYGQLGKGDFGTQEVTNPVQVVGIKGEGYLTDIVDIAAGQYFTVALKKNGEVVAWGYNNYGQLGNCNGNAETPIYVKDIDGNNLTGIIDVSAARDHSAALKADGTVWTWGRNDYGQLGDNTTTSSSYAIQVHGVENNGYLTGIKQISCGGAFVTALSKEGEVYSWGLGTSGQLGNSAKTTYKYPVKATDVADVEKIATTHYTTICLKTDGTVWNWGLNRYGQLGYGSSSTSSSNTNYAKTTQTQVKIYSTTYLTDVVDISGNWATAYAVTSNGEVYGWGLNTEGQIGDNTVTNKAYATRTVGRYYTQISDVTKLQSSSTSSYTSYLIKEDGSIYCNGRVSNGQLLDGDVGYSTRNYAEEIKQSYLTIQDKIDYVKKGTTKTVKVDTVEELNLKGKPSYGNLTYTSTNEDVATIDSNGNLTAREFGTTTIIVTEDLHGYRAQATIYVTENKDNIITSPMVVQGTSFTGILKADGTVWMSGINNYGQLGDGTTTYRGNLAQVKIDENTYLTNVVRIAAGASHCLAVTKDGEVYAWGLGTSGQLGQNGTANSSYAVKVLDETGEKALENIIDVSAGATHSLAVDKNGVLYAWGLGTNYRLGNNSTTTQKLPTIVLNTYNVTGVSAGSAFSVALRGDGRAYGSGANTYGQAGNGEKSDLNGFFLMGDSSNKIIYENLTNVVAGGTHTLLQEDVGKVYVIGLGTSGQLSQGSTSNFTTRKEALILDDDPETDDIETKAIENISFISAGNTFSIAVTKDGKAYICGLNTSGQLGQGDVTSPVDMFTLVKDETGENNLSNVLFSAIGSSNTINSAYILNDGTVWTVGTGASGQLATGSYKNTYLVTRVEEDEFKAKEKIVKLEVNETSQIELSIMQGFNVYDNEQSVSSNLKYEVENESIATVSSTGLITAKKLGYTKVKVTDLDNNLEEYITVTVSNSIGYTEAKLSAGINFTVALKEDGTVWSWGIGTSGRLGTGNTTNQTEPVQVLSPDGRNKLTKVKDIAVGYDSSSALLEDGTVVSWGNNGSYNLGNGTNVDSTVPVYVVDSDGNKIKDIVKIARGNDYCLALTKDGEIYSWGYNNYGQLGLNNVATTQYATKVKDETGKGTIQDVTDIVASMYTSYALKEDGTVYAWGYNADGQLGNGTTSNANTLPKQSKMEDVAKISASAHSAIALKNDGTVWSWGWNAYGQNGIGTTSDAIVPTQCKFDSTTYVTDVIDIGTTGGTHYILDNANKVYAAGNNVAGEVGDDTTTNRSYFVEVKSKYGAVLTNNIVKLSSSMARTDSRTDCSTGYFIREDGSLLGVGKNSSYQLLGKMTTTLKSAKEMNVSYMEITDRVSYLKIGESKKISTNVVENFNMYARAPQTGTINWSSSNEAIATIDSNGNVKAISEGQTTIIAQDSKNGYISSATIYVTRATENAITIPQVAQGLNYTITLKADGTVWASGLNDVGQCGIGSSAMNIAVPEQVKINDTTYLTDVVKISSGLSHTLALTKDGKVYAWGLNSRWTTWK